MAALGVDLFERDPPKYEFHQLFSCSTSFKLYYAKQEKGRTVWKALGSKKNFVIDFDSQANDYSQFQELVAVSCNNQFDSSGPLIRNSIATGNPKIEWHASLLCCPLLPEFYVKSNYHITDASSYNHWIESAASLGKDTISASLKLSMDSPGDIEKRVTAAAEVQNHLLTMEAARAASSSRLPGSLNQLDPEFSASDFEETINLHMERIYKAHPPNIKYEKNLPIFIDSCDHNRYIPLTTAATQTWAKALNVGTAGVSLNSPPTSLHFVNRSSKKRKINDSINSSSSEMGQILAQLIASTSRNPVQSPSNSEGTQSPEDPDPTTIGDYLDFIKIPTSRRAAVLDKLNENDITSFKLFKSKTITEAKMSRWGLSDGIIALLIDNLSKYEKYLHRN